MGFFEKLFSAGQAVLGAPVAGEVVSVKEVADPTFSEEILGKGVAIRPSEGRICAPCDGTVELMFDTGHAVSLKADCGAEILIHVGLETIQLSGAHYTVHAKNADRVTAGQLLIECDLDAIRAAGYDTITPIVICNSGEFSGVSTVTGKTVAMGETIIRLRK